LINHRGSAEEYWLLGSRTQQLPLAGEEQQLFVSETSQVALKHLVAIIVNTRHLWGKNNNAGQDHRAAAFD
jgi:hypothetical protein